MSIVLFLLVLFVLILVHEWGHFIVAKKTGMRVDEFGIGFPPKVYGIKKGETEYTFNALPIGGFVKIYGENLEEIPDDEPDKSRAFGSRPKWAQALVLIAGVAMNVIFAWFLFLVTFLIGTPSPISEIDASKDAVLYVSGVLPNSPLVDEIKPGSEIISIKTNDSELINPKPSTFTNFVQEHKDDNLIISYRDNGEVNTVSVKPTTGLIAGQEDKVAVGVSLAMVENVDRSFGEALKQSFITTGEGLKAITVGLGSLLVGAITGSADLSQVAGPVGIVGMVGDAAQFGLVALLTFTAIISLNLAVINLLPVPALDGGRLLFVAFEAITRRNINPAWAGWMNLVGFALLMLLMIVVTYNDIVRLFTN